MTNISQSEDYLQDEPYCVYCEQIKEVRPWNGELICYDCRLKFLDKEFDKKADEVIVLKDFESIKSFLENISGF